jgi:3-oxoacyl-[acyl-carrier protein] reductase
MRLMRNTAIVTGGARGIGSAICRAFAREGAKVLIVDIDLPLAEALASDIRAAHGPAVHALSCDITSPESVEEMFRNALDRFGRVDILVNNAGICPLTPFESISPGEWDKVLEINLKGAFLCCQKVIGPMQEQAYGRIINISSVSGKMGGVLVGAHYAASKAGLIALTFCLARAYASQGVTANVIAPATVETDMTRTWPKAHIDALVRAIPAGRLGQPSDVAEAAVFLASREAAFITGEVLDVNGGFLMD